MMDTVGKALYYEIRYSKVPITDLTWDAAVPVINAPVSGNGRVHLQSMIVIGLEPETSYYLAIRTTDEQKNRSPLSNIVGSQTTELVISSGTSMDKFIGTNAFIDDPLEKIKVAGICKGIPSVELGRGRSIPE